MPINPGGSPSANTYDVQAFADTGNQVITPGNAVLTIPIPANTRLNGDVTGVFTNNIVQGFLGNSFVPEYNISWSSVFMGFNGAGGHFGIYFSNGNPNPNYVVGSNAMCINLAGTPGTAAVPGTFLYRYNLSGSWTAIL
jgi:hypothetical protein